MTLMTLAHALDITPGHALALVTLSASGRLGADALPDPVGTGGPLAQRWDRTAIESWRAAPEHAHLVERRRTAVEHAAATGSWDASAQFAAPLPIHTLLDGAIALAS